MSEFEEVMKTAMESLQKGEPAALAAVVRARGSTPRHTGARMLVWADGRIAGTVGGATLEQRVIEDALDVLKDGKSRLENYVFSTREEDKDSSVGLCGGSVDVYIERLDPDPILIIIGAGHVAIPLARMAAAIDMRVVIVDDRAEYATRERFPDAAQIHVVQYDEQTETLAPMPVEFTPATYVVATTWGWDLPALKQVLAGRPAYVGLVSSKTKWRTIAERLKVQGVPDEAIARVHAPIGLDLGAETPAEIAVSILAEILSVRRGATSRALSEIKK